MTMNNHEGHAESRDLALICRHAFEAGWITGIGTSRAVQVTSAGQHALRDHLGLPDEVLAPS